MATLMSSSTMACRGIRSPAIVGRRGIRCSATVAGENYYKTLSLRPGATEKEVKKAFRKLALQYHPDVCKGSQCSIKFNQINQAYHMILDELKRPEQPEEAVEYDAYADDESSDEWMGYEAAYFFSGGRPESVYFY
ncbi:Chaperone protein DnaJ [Rhynchospora pubera]|uniref:Chaperone protein DnaJ n=1 Tax=Rhynchospora pubera TaxID=906938 RepID=A0AAV8ASB3_9POAL|nr:Chaperone protein DnaJ [Rhynchospora pubera]KAJ4733561.1 Chaperone protein DnaJ [Rhynchospora pubera]KAJ4758133.1 Chaperone protein DnaJ [Rhynchospora pubera]